MNDFFNELKKLSYKQSKEIAAMCGGVALLVLVASFFSAGGFANKGISVELASISPGTLTADIFPCSWFDDCSSATQIHYGLTANTTTVSPGQGAVLTWVAYSVSSGVTEGSCLQGDRDVLGNPVSAYNCSITGVGPVGTPCVGGNVSYTDYDGNVQSYYDYCTNAGSRVYAGSVGVYPTNTTTYSFCGTRYFGYNGNGYALLPFPTPCPSVTITVPQPTRTTLTSVSVSPSTVQSGNGTTLYWGGTPGTHFYGCDVIGGQFGGGTWFGSLPGAAATAALTANTQYAVQCYDTTYGWSGPMYATVSIAPPPIGPCTDIPTAPSVPTGCVGPTPQPLGSCIPTGGSYSAPSNSCSCPANQHLAGTACVNNPLCSNGLNDSYAPSCTCPAHQYQPLGASSCAALPTCTNGLGEAYSPSCTCPSGQVQVTGGSTCTEPGVINSLTVNPSRERAGNTTIVTWSTTRMSSCTLSAFDNTGTTNVSSALSSSASATINGTTIFTLSCTDRAGLVYSSSAKVTLIPKTSEI